MGKPTDADAGRRPDVLPGAERNAHRGGRAGRHGEHRAAPRSKTANRWAAGLRALCSLLVRLFTRLAHPFRLRRRRRPDTLQRSRSDHRCAPPGRRCAVGMPRGHSSSPTPRRTVVVAHWPRRWLEHLPAFGRCVLPAAILVTASLAVLAISQLTRLERDFQHASEHVLDVQTGIIEFRLNMAASDLELLSSSNWLRALPSSLNDGQRTLLEHQLIAFAESRGLYDQVAYIDLSGREVVRIDLQANGVVTTAARDLQDRANQSYVIIGLKLPPGEMFISPLDRSIQTQAVPMSQHLTLRLVAPVFDPDGSRRGIVVLNCLIAPLLTEVRHAGEAIGTPMLLDRHGHWIIGPRPEDEWGFPWPDGYEATLARRDPRLWSRIEAASTGKFLSPEGAFAFTTIGYRRIQPMRRLAGTILQPTLPMAAENEEWKLVLFLPTMQIMDQAQMRVLAAVGLVLLCVTTALCILVARHLPIGLPPPFPGRRATGRWW